MDDEWFVVWLLLVMTKEIPGLAAQVWDDDGEFLLVEVSQMSKVRSQRSKVKGQRSEVKVNSKQESEWPDDSHCRLLSKAIEYNITLHRGWPYIKLREPAV